MRNSHEGKYKEAGYMLDQWECSCGWVSEVYFDGYVYAKDEWRRHIEVQTKQDQLGSN